MKMKSFARRNALLPRGIGPVALGAILIAVLAVAVRIIAPGFFIAAASPVWRLSNAAAAAAGSATAAFANPIALQKQLDGERAENAALANENATLAAKAQDLENLLGSRVDAAPGVGIGFLQRGFQRLDDECRRQRILGRLEFTAAAAARESPGEHVQAARVRARHAIDHLVARQLGFQRILGQQAEVEAGGNHACGRFSRGQFAEAGDQRMADALDHPPLLELAFRGFAQRLLERGQQAPEQLLLHGRKHLVSIVQVATDGIWRGRNGHGAWRGLAFS